MECPTPCHDCGDFVELDDLNFWVGCDCDRHGKCSHGICDQCKANFEQEGE